MSMSWKTNKRTGKRFPSVQDRRAAHSLDVQFRRGIHAEERKARGLTPDQPMYQVGQHVRTVGGTSGRIIGSAQYATGWEYRIVADGSKPDPRTGKPRSMYREEWQIEGPNEGMYTNQATGFRAGLPGPSVSQSERAFSGIAKGRKPY